MTVESSNPAPRSARCEVFVLGGGPAGATAAALLAERGKRDCRKRTTPDMITVFE